MLAYDKTNLTPNEIQNAVLLSMLITDKTEWISSDAEIASVDENGIVTALKEGACKIKVKSGEHEFTCDVLVDFQKRADEEFLEYVERIGAYTELPLGTDGSAGPTAQYVTFGFKINYADEYYSNGSFLFDENTETVYKNLTYVKGSDGEWYYYVKYAQPHYGEKVIPRKWRLVDKERGLLFMEGINNERFVYATWRHLLDSGLWEPYDEQIKNAIKQITTLCDYETSSVRAEIDGGEYLQYWTVFYGNNEGERTGFSRIEPHIDNKNFESTYSFYKFNTERQLAQIKEVDLDCGEGGYTKGRIFIPSEDEMNIYFSKGKIPDFFKYGQTLLTRTRKEIDGENKLCAVMTNEDGTFKNFTYIDGYNLSNHYWYFIPAICVKPAP